METDFEIRCQDRDMAPDEYRGLPKHPLIFVLDNLRSTFNVGAIFRVCDVLRAEALFLCGYTPCPPNEKLEKTAVRTTAYVPWRYFKSTVHAVISLKERGIPVWAAETTSKSVSYLNVQYPHRLAIVLGNEAFGISESVLVRCDRIIEIPTYGFKNSLNVAAACAVLGFKALESFGTSFPARATCQTEANSRDENP